ncbi:hypothetical protein V6x_55480 [Gimesia chilikensis]|uniref:Uncharacterized protein n=1 Tax=Gimesia chilikensis TaxID=2605989 RepID=A0A517WKL7_9PLAN|nr:hypothetical protein V6x_55480 [Gimesia chilikensis]
MDSTCFVFGLLRLLSGMALLSCHAADSVEGRGGVKTEFCPNVARFCPGVSGILSHSGRGLSASALPWGRLFRRGAQCSGEKQVKSEGVGGADVTVVLEMQCSEDAPRARARRELTYDSVGVDQGQSVQAVVDDFQWGRMLDRRWSSFLPRKARKARKFLVETITCVRLWELVKLVELPAANAMPLRVGGLFQHSAFALSVSCSLRSARILFGPTRSFQVPLWPHWNAILDCSLPGGRTHRSAPYDEGWWAGSSLGVLYCDLLLPAAIPDCIRDHPSYVIQKLISEFRGGTVFARSWV